MHHRTLGEVYKVPLVASGNQGEISKEKRETFEFKH